MAERKKTPDILADLLGTTPTTGNAPAESEKDSDLAVKQKDSKTEYRQNSKTLSPNNGETVTQSGSAIEQERVGEERASSNTESKIKVTFYLSEDTVDLFEEAQRALRRLGRSQGSATSKSATSKSALLEEALKLVCNDIQANGMESQLARKMF